MPTLQPYTLWLCLAILLPVALANLHRRIHEPLLKLVRKLDDATPGRSVAILIPELVVRHWWERLLHGRQAQRVRAALVEHAGSRLMIITSPWRG